MGARRQEERCNGAGAGGDAMGERGTTRKEGCGGMRNGAAWELGARRREEGTAQEKFWAR